MKKLSLEQHEFDVIREYILHNNYKVTEESMPVQYIKQEDYCHV